MKKIVIFIVTILVLGVLAMTTCIQNSKRIEQEKEREQIANINNEEITVAEDNEIQSNIIEKEEEKVNIVIEDGIIEQEKIVKKKDSKEITKTTDSNAKIEQNINKTDEKKEVEETKKTEPKNTETKKETPINSNYTEVNVNVAENKKCDGNNHGMSAGNTGLWFETKDEAIATYKSEIKKWGDKWTNDEISDDEYYKNCPYGYEVWSCPYCNKWTLNYYLDK